MNITLNINIENINIAWDSQAQEEPVQPLTVEPEAVIPKVLDVTQALSNKYRLATKIRVLAGDEAANNFLAGVPK